MVYVAKMCLQATLRNKAIHAQCTFQIVSYAWSLALIYNMGLALLI